LFVGAGALIGCAPWRVWGDGSSVSLGASNGGRTRRPARVPDRGAHHVVPARWADRGLRYGTDELVGVLLRVAELLHAREPKARLGLADLSPLAGGKSEWHASHQSGRDVDVLFFHADPRGRPLASPDDMIAFDRAGKPFLSRARAAKGESYEVADWARRRFDTARNWAFVEALLRDPEVRVQWIFVASPLRQRLLEWAEAQARPRWVIEYARAVMKQPSAAAPHDDHFHVRLYCDRDDRPFGCRDTGPVWRHEKKAYKYAGVERYDPWMWRRLRGTWAAAPPR
jgi:penicillin-insensitive murein endopeptidase